MANDSESGKSPVVEANMQVQVTHTTDGKFVGMVYPILPTSGMVIEQYGYKFEVQGVIDHGDGTYVVYNPNYQFHCKKVYD